ncbi:hypothetical protein BUALT_Bualt02G0061300 [Buddleja alternifolia]|uniref:Uncharacterized protein n=1 Tax=Buddleja alternifolia TaxID=168488 RepID=A0AAV6XYD5_9LAMI|nr:hypothetical protein BUALT_Bualt02G0061300 [Buddleja alternifolia]
MGSFSGLGIGLSFVFGCILMGLVAELYYLLWWKKKIAYNNSNTEIEEFSYLFCWRRPNSTREQLTNSVRNPQEQQQDLEMGPNKDLEGGLKGYGEEGIETELMRMHNLCGPPRFLFTIKEESKEDLESDDGRSRSSRKGSRTNKSLSDLVFGVDVTPLASPIARASLDCCYNNHGFNPLFESLSEAEVNRLRSSPPPKFKFLKDAEDKLIRRLLVEENERKRAKVESEEDNKNACFVSLSHKNQQASQVLPLASSPTLKTFD